MLKLVCLAIWLVRRRPGGRQSRLQPGARVDAAGRGPQLRGRQSVRVHGRQRRRLPALRLPEHARRDLREGRRHAGDRHLRFRRCRFRLRHVLAPIATRASPRRSSAWAGRSCRGAPSSPRVNTTWRSPPNPRAITPRSCRQWTAALEKTVARQHASLRWRCPGSPTEEQQSLRLVPESVLGIRILKRGYVAQYDFGKAFVVTEASTESAAAVMQKLRAAFRRDCQGVGRRRCLPGDRQVPGTDLHLPQGTLRCGLRECGGRARRSEVGYRVGLGADGQAGGLSYPLA